MLVREVILLLAFLVIVKNELIMTDREHSSR